MAAQNPPYALQSGSHGSELFRRAVGSTLNPAGGVVGLGDLLVTQNSTPNMSVNVAGGRPGGEAWIPGSTTTGQGMYYVYNDGTVNLAIAAANATNPRIDTVIAQVQDAAYSGSTNAWQLAVVTGTPTAGATLTNLTGAGTVPASSLVLAYVLVPASSTSVITANIQDARVFARPNLPLRSNPSGRAYLNTSLTSLTIAGTTNYFLGNTSPINAPAMTAQWLNGGMTLGSSGSTNACLVVPVAGYYQVNAGMTYTEGTQGVVQVGISKNLGAITASRQQALGVGSTSMGSEVSDIVQCAAGDALGIFLVASASGVVTAVTGSANGWQTSISATLVSL